MLHELAREYKERTKRFSNYELDSHSMAEGVYVRFSLTEPIDSQLKDLESRTLIYNRKDELDKQQNELFEWFKKRDFYNVVLNDDSNKVVDTKRKIWSTTMYSLALREKNVEKASMDDILGFFESHFSKLSSDFRKSELAKVVIPLIKEKKNKNEELDKELNRQFPDLMKRLNSSDRESLYEQCFAFFKEHFFKIRDELLDLFGEKVNKDKYIKLYLDFPVDDYEEEFKLYAYPKIFRKNEYNASANNEAVGVPMFGINLNEKKPFLEFKTTRFQYPMLLPLTDALLYREIFPWIKYLKNDNEKGTNRNKKVSYHEVHDEMDMHSFHYVLIDGNDIVDYDNIPVGTKAIKFTWRNVININLGEHVDQRIHERVTNLHRLRSLANQYLFANRISYAYYQGEVKAEISVFTSQMAAMFIQSRQNLFDFFFKSPALGLSKQTKKNMLEFLYEQMRQGITNMSFKKDSNSSNPNYMSKQKDYYARGINLYISICDYIEEGEPMATKIIEVQESLKEHLLSKNEYHLQTTEEFYYLSGQLSFYIIKNFSKAKNKDYSALSPLMNARKPVQVKRFVQNQFATYSHEISLSHGRLKQAMQWIQEFDTTENPKLTENDKTALFAGLTADNLFYMAKENSENE
ncbi:hypothetical protein U8V72_15405 [Priestia filamentosa]|uniref:hypothetical protein n=1 Tax=Priestia filamentosa TaxID=1402861 RepID=UPI0005893811